MFNPAYAASRDLINEIEWRLPPQTFKHIDALFGPHHVEFFASADIMRLALYVSRTHDPKALWTNALTRPWTSLAHLRLLILYPWHLILEILRPLDAHPQPATLITPN
ncbi:hypothetical protein BC940DRAFT_328455 [Gongronella butleri]|nr:hypothetical protein BC940DRAFT_328455 [Gongronella butleri]